MSKTYNTNYAARKFVGRRSIEREIARINDTIDRKIVRGISYRIEARKHARLKRELEALSSRGVFGFNSIISFL
jgi:hypothetical protein